MSAIAFSGTRLCSLCVTKAAYRLEANRDHPYPSHEQKKMWAMRSTLTATQIDSFLINRRKRTKRSDLREVYLHRRAGSATNAAEMEVNVANRRGLAFTSSGSALCDAGGACADSTEQAVPRDADRVPAGSVSHSERGATLPGDGNGQKRLKCGHTRRENTCTDKNCVQTIGAQSSSGASSTAACDIATTNIGPDRDTLFDELRAWVGGLERIGDAGLVLALLVRSEVSLANLGLFSVNELAATGMGEAAAGELLSQLVGDCVGQ